MLGKVKLALRINHDLLDASIMENIDAARAEMVRVGIAEIKAQDTNDPLISTAIKTYCLWQLANDTKMTEGYFKSWQYQIENLRNTPGYMEENKNV